MVYEPEYCIRLRDLKKLMTIARKAKSEKEAWEAIVEYFNKEFFES